MNHETDFPFKAIRNVIVFCSNFADVEEFFNTLEEAIEWAQDSFFGEGEVYGRDADGFWKKINLD